MQPKPKDPDSVETAPSVAFVVGVSLFGYPGAGHLLLGKKREGIAFVVLFTLATVAVVFEIWFMLPELYKLMVSMVDMQAPYTITRWPNWPRMGLWVAISGVLWVASAVRSAQFAREKQAEMARTAPAAREVSAGAFQAETSSGGPASDPQ